MTERAQSAKASRGTVTVGCRMANGLILRLFRMVPSVEKTAGGGTIESKVASLAAAPITIRGNRFDPTTLGERDAPLIRQGAGLTPGVDGDFMDEWMRQNADSDLVRNNIIFIAKDDREAEAAAKDLRNEYTGLEPIKQDGDPRMPKRVERGVVTEQAAA